MLRTKQEEILFAIVRCGSKDVTKKQIDEITHFGKSLSEQLEHLIRRTLIVKKHKTFKVQAGAGTATRRNLYSIHPDPKRKEKVRRILKEELDKVSVDVE